MDENGLPIYDGEGKTLLDRVEFHESDLLAFCRDYKIELDRIVGCIPQVRSKWSCVWSKYLFKLVNMCLSALMHQVIIVIFSEIPHYVIAIALEYVAVNDLS